jgi:hypothetical protein
MRAMTRTDQTLFGTLLFRTKGDGKATVLVYRSKGTFTLKRLPDEERSNIDVYKGDIAGYISEATLRWPDLERDGVEWTPSDR